MKESELTIATKDGSMRVLSYAPPGRRPAVIQFMDAFGVRPSMRAIASRLAEAGYRVLLPDLYYRQGAKELSLPDGFQEGLRLMRTLTADGVRMDVQALLDHLDREGGAERVGCFGYCMGGRIALSVAGMFGDRVAAAASFHGGGLAGDAPDAPVRMAERMRARLYVGVADKDATCPPEHVAQLGAAFQAAGLAYQIEGNPGALHGYAVEDMPVYDREAADRHWRRLLTLLAETFG